MLWTILGILVLLWLFGFIANVGPLIHLVLVVALVVFIVDRLTRRRVV
jgi:hypothetical protein